jgi:membrane protein implicated in regulation of membrane protease activity
VGDAKKNRSMRRITPVTTVGKVNMPAPLSKEVALLALLLVVAVWVGYAFAQEMLLNHRLNAQAAELRQQNAAIAAANNGYRRDLLASSVGAAADEDARQHGYARNDERVYVVGRPAPTPTSAVPARTDGKIKLTGQQGGLWESLGRWIANFWHR